MRDDVEEILAVVDDEGGAVMLHVCSICRLRAQWGKRPNSSDRYLYRKQSILCSTKNRIYLAR